MSMNFKCFGAFLFLKGQISGNFWEIAGYHIYPIGFSPSGYGTTADGTTSEAGMAWRG